LTANEFQLVGDQVKLVLAFELYKDKGGKFRFRLKAGNGEIIPSSEVYETKASAKSGVESVRKNAADATVVDLTE
jgi:uncharacterized protein YegP (UPF0339 family)